MLLANVFIRSTVWEQSWTRHQAFFWTPCPSPSQYHLTFLFWQEPFVFVSSSLICWLFSFFVFLRINVAHMVQSALMHIRKEEEERKKAPPPPPVPEQGAVNSLSTWVNKSFRAWVYSPFGIYLSIVRWFWWVGDMIATYNLIEVMKWAPCEIAVIGPLSTATFWQPLIHACALHVSGVSPLTHIVLRISHAVILILGGCDHRILSHNMILHDLTSIIII